ncbi:hypothetical protein [Gorillibacterium massiliense]|uniref:hypothetical protein n=1 Tax=Gorillibacterium massiliense TaxID=1280390 RepID=UPI0004B4041B|nr:hypothetical protein [Gorillibacterium massiliense]
MSNPSSSHYFARGNTARGAHFLYRSAFHGLNKIFILTGPPGTGKSTAIRNLADSLLDAGQHVQQFHSPLRPDELDGIIATELKVGIVDGRVCEGISGIEMGEIAYINFEEAVDRRLLFPQHQETIESLNIKLADAYAKAYESFLTALRIHDEWEKYYIESMDFVKADQVTQNLIQDLFTGHETDTPTVGRHLFFGAATPKGALDFIQQLTAPLERRIFIKGRPGSGKSTLLKKLAASAETNGIEVQVFHCGFDPNSLDMLIFPQLSIAIFDSTAPHEYFPNRSGDEILDMYALTMTSGTDEAYATEISAIKERYSAKMKEATSHLLFAADIDSQIKAYYVAATNFSVIEECKLHLQSELNELLSDLIIGTKSYV